jgi:hypothetical protein
MLIIYWAVAVLGVVVTVVAGALGVVAGTAGAFGVETWAVRKHFRPKPPMARQATCQGD